MADPKPGSAIKALFKTPDKGGPKDKKVNEKDISTEKKTSGGSPSNVWSAPPKVAVDVNDLIQRARAIADLVKAKGPSFNLEQVRLDQQKRTVSVFAFDKKTKRTVRATKDLVIKSLTGLGVKVLAVIAGISYPFWDVLLPTSEDAVALTRKPLDTKDHVFRVEYLGRRRTTVTVFDVPGYFFDENIAAYMMQYGEIIDVSHDSMRGEWRFDLMIDHKTFHSIPNWLDLDGRKLPIIVNGRKPACWRWKSGRKMPGEESPCERARPNA